MNFDPHDEKAMWEMAMVDDTYSYPRARHYNDIGANPDELPAACELWTKTDHDNDSDTYHRNLKNFGYRVMPDAIIHHVNHCPFCGVFIKGVPPYCHDEGEPFDDEDDDPTRDEAWARQERNAGFE